MKNNFYSKNFFITYFQIFLIGILFSSCGIYRQNVVNAPLLHRKGQTQLSAHASATGYDAQAACAITKQIALLANYSDMGTKRITSSATNYTIDKHNFAEFGAGYYKKNATGISYEFFILAGKGMSSRFSTGGDTTKGQTPPYAYFRNANYNRFLIQADFWKSKHNWEFAVSPRIFVLHYYNISDNQTGVYRGLSSSYVLTDLAATLRYSLFKCLKLSAQASGTLPLTGYKVGYFESSPFNFSFGVILNLNFIKIDEDDMDK